MRLLCVWYHQIRPKVARKVVHGYQNKDKNITITTQKSVNFSLQCIITKKKYVILHPVSAAILDFILNILQRGKTPTACQSNSPNATAA